MSSRKPITIIGGGLAGLTLGIGLRRHGVPVTLWEAGKYPRHRVCGEFISGRGLETLERLDLKKLLLGAGAVTARTAAFFSRTIASRIKTLPSSALCLSRFRLDAALAEEFSKSGGDLRTGERWRGDFFQDGVVRATGRHARPLENGWRWFGLKAHARNVTLKADLEMHVAPNGYVGLCRLADDDVNVCGLFRRRAGADTTALDWRDLLRGEEGSWLRKRMVEAIFDESSFCSVAGLSLSPQRAAAQHDYCIGDAITMIPPVTGNGMSMAFESAEIALAPLAAWSTGATSWIESRKIIARTSDTAFNRRLKWAGRLQTLMLSPVWQIPLVHLISRSKRFWRGWFDRTR